MANYENLQNDIEDLKKQVWSLTKTLQGGSSGNTPVPSGDWTTLYDKNSDDPTINMGFTSGIMGSTGQIAAFPDLAPYNHLKVLFSCGGNRMYYEFDITDKSDNNYRMFLPNNINTTYFGMSFTIAVRNGKTLIEFANCTKVDIYSNRFPAITNCKNNTLYHIVKIEAK